MASEGIESLMSPRSVAVIGASADPSKTAGRPVTYLRRQGFKGSIWPVNPRVDQIDGMRCYPDIASIPGVPDVAIVLLGAEHAHRAVAEVSARGAKAAIVLASGYAESGEAGARRQRELVAAAGAMRLLGPNTIGLVNLTDGIVLSASGALDMATFPVGAIGVVSQSGGILGSLLSRAAARGIGLSKLISTSNEVDLELADFVDYLADDPETRVIALYIESIRNPARFRAAARKASLAGKPIVAFKVGRSEGGARAAVSHTGALAGSDRMFDAFFRDLGIIRAQRFDDLLDMPTALATGRALKGNRIAVLTSTGGAGTLVADSLGFAGFDTPPPDATTAAHLRALQSGDHAALDRNPIDVTLAGLQPTLLRKAIGALFESTCYDGLVVIVGSSGVADPGLMAGAIRDCLASSDKPVIAYVSPHAPEAAALLTRFGVPAFVASESCAVAFDAMRRVARTRSVDVTRIEGAGSSHEAGARDPGSSPRESCPNGGGETVGVAPSIGDLPSGILDEAQAQSLFARFGVPCARAIVVTTSAEAEVAARSLGPKVVLKLLSNEITHKSDVGGVRIGLSPDTIGDAMTSMARDVRRKAGFVPQRFLVQEQIDSSVEMIVGLRRDPLGSALMVGLGGVSAELWGDTAMRMLPEGGMLSAETAHAMLRELKGWPLLDGYRGRPKADVSALVAALKAFCAMATRLGDRLQEAEINPLIVRAGDAGVFAADGVIVLADGS